MNSSSEPKNGLSVVLGVMRAGQLVADVLELQGRDGQAFALDSADDLADHPPLDAVGLDQHKGPLSHGRQRTAKSAPRSLPRIGYCRSLRLGRPNPLSS